MSEQDPFRLTGLIAITLALVAALALWVSSSAPVVARASAMATVRVPNLVGRAWTTAQCSLADARLRLTSEGELYRRPGRGFCSGGVQVAPDPRVVRQSPAAGTLVVPGSPVDVVTECSRSELPPGTGCA